MPILANATVEAIVCRQRPVPCAVTIRGARQQTVVTNDQRMLGILVDALLAGKEVDVSYGRRVEFYTEHTTRGPVVHAGYLLETVAVPARRAPAAGRLGRAGARISRGRRGSR
jgi:hypothetical protein